MKKAENLAGKSNCINNTINCLSGDLDINSECEYCQAKFYHKMMAKTKTKGKTGFHKKQKYTVDNIPLYFRETIIKEATNLYKIKFTSKQKLVDWLNDKYNTKMTQNTLNNLTKDSNLKKYNLNWKYKNV